METMTINNILLRQIEYLLDGDFSNLSDIQKTINILEHTSKHLNKYTNVELSLTEDNTKEYIKKTSESIVDFNEQKLIIMPILFYHFLIDSISNEWLSTSMLKTLHNIDANQILYKSWITQDIIRYIIEDFLKTTNHQNMTNDNKFINMIKKKYLDHVLIDICHMPNITDIQDCNIMPPNVLILNLDMDIDNHSNNANNGYKSLAQKLRKKEKELNQRINILEAKYSWASTALIDTVKELDFHKSKVFYDFISNTQFVVHVALFVSTCLISYYS